MLWMSVSNEVWTGTGNTQMLIQDHVSSPTEMFYNFPEFQWNRNDGRFLLFEEEISNLYIIGD